MADQPTDTTNVETEDDEFQLVQTLSRDDLYHGIVDARDLIGAHLAEQSDINVRFVDRNDNTTEVQIWAKQKVHPGPDEFDFQDPKPVETVEAAKPVQAETATGDQNRLSGYVRENEQWPKGQNATETTELTDEQKKLEKKDEKAPDKADKK